jgi:hypothetical protein
MQKTGATFKSSQLWFIFLSFSPKKMHRPARPRASAAVIPGAASSPAPPPPPLACARLAVHARLRPLLPLDGEGAPAQRLALQAQPPAVRVLPEGAPPAPTAARATAARTFPFSSVLGAAASQAEAYRGTTAASVGEALAGANAVVLVYGQSGAGKTHTVFGPSDHDPAAATARDAAGLGLIPRALHDLFERIGVRAAAAAAAAADAAAAAAAAGAPPPPPPAQYSVSASCCQLYNDVWVDLLADGLRVDHKLTPERAVREPAGSVRAILDLLHRSARHKAVAATALNSHSSRGHTVFQARIARSGGGGGGESASTLTFVDLAGSERLARVGHAPGSALAHETRSINSSLHALGAVLAAMAGCALRRAAAAGAGGEGWGGGAGALGGSAGGGGGLGGSLGGSSLSSSLSSSLGSSGLGGGGGGGGGSGSAGFIPWRDSRLTRFLQGCLEPPPEPGAPHPQPSTLSLIVCLAPADASLAESVSSCHFAARALAVHEALAGRARARRPRRRPG